MKYFSSSILFSLLITFNLFGQGSDELQVMQVLIIINQPFSMTREKKPFNISTQKQFSIISVYSTWLKMGIVLPSIHYRSLIKSLYFPSGIGLPKRRF